MVISRFQEYLKVLKVVEAMRHFDAYR